MIRRRTITSYVWNSVSGNKMVILLNCIRNFFRKFELIGNSVQGENPAPDNPQEIKSAGRKSKNLFDITKLKKGAGENYPTEIELVGETLIAKKDGGTANQMTFEIELENLEPNTTYEFTTKQIICKRKDSDTEKAGTIFSFRAYKNESQIENKGNVFTTGESESDIYKILFGIIAGDFGSLEYVKIEQPMLSHSKGSYEPYSDKYKIDIKVTGKNLFDREKARDITNWIVRDGNGYAKFPIRVGKGNKVTFYYSEKLTTGKGFYVGITQSETSAIVSWLYHSAETNLNNKKYTAVAAGDYIYLSCTISGIQKFVDTIQTLQVEIGGEQTPYEPYTEQTVQIALDEPLRGIGEYKDVLTKDGVVRRIKEVVITADTPITCMLGQYGAPETNTVLCRYHDTSLKKTGAVLCEELKNIDNWAKEEESVFMTEQGIDFRLSRERLGLGSNTTPEENKAAVIKYLENHPLHCIAELNEPITEPLLESVQQQLQALHSENGVTHVFVDSGEVEAGINIEYKYKS